ncbi:hypothetical protein ASG43_19980 [Aureimonas sp. Leaf454]|nr:hypothetical protein ASG43_19980 [Aureimonas sp. Leaf454]
MRALRDLRILGTAATPEFDRLCRMAQTVFGTPISLVTLINEEAQWFKAKCGLDIDGTGRDVAFCDHAIRSDDVLVIPDTLQDERFADNPFVTGEPFIRFYAGAPLILAPGVRLGTVCVVDSKPRSVSEKEVAVLRQLADAAVCELRRHRAEIAAREERQAGERELSSHRFLLSRAEAETASGSWQFDRETGVPVWSDGLYRLLGHEPDRTTPPIDLFRRHVHSEDMSMLDHALEALAGDKPFGIELRIVDAKGETRWLSSRGEPFPDAVDGSMRMIGVVRDITDAKKAEAALRDSEEHYRNVVELNPRIPWSADPDGAILSVSDRWCELTGFSKEQALGHGWLEALHPDDLLPTAEIWSRCLETREPVVCEYRFVQRDGGYRWFRAEGAPKLSPDGQILRWYGTCEDIHERKHAEEALKESEAFSGSVLESSADCIAVLDLEGNIVFMNERGLRAMGMRTSADSLGRHWTSLWPREYAPFLADAVLVAKGGSGCRFSTPYALEGERAKWWDVHLGPIRKADGKPGRLLAVARDVTEQRRSQARVEHAARHDPLTGLSNRLKFNETLAETLSRADGTEVAIHILDLDDFKEVNDTLGHSVGDALLCEVAHRLSDKTDGAGVLARLGGDEFAVIQAVSVSGIPPMNLAELLVDCMAEPFDIAGDQIRIGVTVGVAVARRQGRKPEDLLKEADIALHRAKAEGGATALLYEPEMQAGIHARQALKRDLALALDRDELSVVYQPLLSLGSQRVCGFEALLRWMHPVRGAVSPAEFIPLAEETGLILPIGEWVLERACQEAFSWPADVRVAVNVSPVQFRSRGLPLRVAAVLAATGLPASRLELEITESVLLHDSEANLELLHALKALGVRIALDDFGTGYSSLGYLRTFPFDKIKIDRSFVGDIGVSHHSEAIIEAVGNLGQSLSMVTTAEGVETQEQLDWLASRGWMQAQGYLVGRPTTPDMLGAWFEGKAWDKTRPSAWQPTAPAHERSSVISILASGRAT